MERDYNKDVDLLYISVTDNGVKYANYRKRKEKGRSMIKPSAYGEYFLAKGSRVYMSDLKPVSAAR